MTSSVQGVGAFSAATVLQKQISDMPDELISTIFSYLCAEDLCRCSGVSSRFRRIACDDVLWKNFELPPSLKIFDGSDWERYVHLSSAELTVEELPPVNK